MRILSLHVIYAKALQEKVLGLIGKTKPYPIFFKTRLGIHTFGVKFPLDILILDKNAIVRVVKQPLKQRQLFFWNPFYDAVVELPEGTIKKKNINIGDKIELITS